jgi:hypothetical protein
MERVDAAEKEASEVLHTLLSVERVKKQGCELNPHQQQVCYASQYRIELSPSPCSTLISQCFFIIMFGLFCLGYVISY